MLTTKRSRASSVKGSRLHWSEQRTDAYFAWLGRDDDAELSDSVRLLESVPQLQELLDALQIPTLVLNEKGQAVLLNRCWQDRLGHELDLALGQRPGELLNCIHAADGTDGCGTSEDCSRCGVAESIWESNRSHARTARDCDLQRVSAHSTEVREWRVVSTPLRVGGRSFTIFSVIEHA
ncbi:MAG: hypothetical protein NTY19_02370 [Planctomycetota bacterium]|nr:hypothetical protein [Planctomycetota bacterium]